MSTPENMTPAEIDTVLAEIYSDAQDVQDEVQRLLHRIVQTERTLVSESLPFMKQGHISAIAEMQTMIETKRFELKMLEGDALPYEEEFSRRGGWTRFFSVAGGHIHSSMSCKSCNKNGKPTRFGWLPEWSGRSESEALDALTQDRKTVLCSICFPNAPVALFSERPDPNKCPGSGKPFQGERMGTNRRPWAHCPECNKGVALTTGWNLRSHKR